MDGALFGWTAGVLMLFAEVAASLVEADPVWPPLQPLKQLVLGGPHVSGAQSAFIIGFAFHSVLSAIFGAFFCAGVNHFFPMRVHRSWGRIIGFGIAYGAVLWLLNLQLIARLVFPSFAQSPALTQLLIHAFAFGLPLALMYCGSERRVGYSGPSNTPSQSLGGGTA